MKLEKKKFKPLPTIKWGVLAACSTPTSIIQTLPVLLTYNHMDETPYSHILSERFFRLDHASRYTPLQRSYPDHTISIFDKYHVFRFSSFINFFERQNVDIPLCFKKTHSIRRPSFELPFLKLTNYLMRQGKKEKTFLLLARVFTSFFCEHKENPSYTKVTLFANWLTLFFLFNNTSLSKQRSFNLSFAKYLPVLNNHFFKNKTKYHFFRSHIHAVISRYLFQIQPLFHFSLFSLSKKARKSGNKKKPKYIFIWKYTPVYKRKSVLLKLLVKDVKFNNGRTFEDRLFFTFSTLYFTPQQSYIFKVNHFTHNYVFKNFRRSLLSNFKTTA